MIKRFINSFKDNYKREKTFDKAMKGKQEVENTLEDMKKELDEVIKKYTIQLEKNNGLYEEKSELFYKVKEYKKELALEKENSKKLIEDLQKTISDKKKENRRLSKENEELLAKQLGE